jgi:hypothetical protein
MGILWRLLAPKPVKRARRSVRKVTHPVHTVTRAVTPKPVKKLQRAAHPLSLAELKAEDAAVKALRGKTARRPTPKRTATRRAAGNPAKTPPARAAPHAAAQQPQPRPGTETGLPPPSGQRQAQIAARYARRQARISERAAARQAKATGRERVYQAKATARGQRRAARRAVRGPWQWPEWSLIGALAALVAWITLVIIAGSHPSSAPGIAAIPLFLAGALAAVIAGPAVLWRRHRVRQAAAARLTAAASHDANQAAPPGTMT